MNVYFPHMIQDGLRHGIAEWVYRMEDDKTGAVHRSWLEEAPWATDKNDKNRLLRLTTDSLEPWVPVWEQFGINQTKESRLALSKEFPTLALWINLFDKDYNYTHPIDRLVHASIHQDFLKFHYALEDKTDTRDLTDILPAWVALTGLASALSNPELADSNPEVVISLVDFTRMLANPCNKVERSRSQSMLALLSTAPELDEIYRYVLANTAMTTPYDLESELRLAKIFPLSTFKSAVENRDVKQEDLNALMAGWPCDVRVAYDISTSLGDSEASAAEVAWSSYRTCFKSKTMQFSPPALDFTL